MIYKRTILRKKELQLNKVVQLGFSWPCQLGGPPIHVLCKKSILLIIQDGNYFIIECSALASMLERESCCLNTQSHSFIANRQFSHGFSSTLLVQHSAVLCVIPNQLFNPHPHVNSKRGTFIVWAFTPNFGFRRKCDTSSRRHQYSVCKHSAGVQEPHMLDMG